VNEEVLAALVRRDEAETLGVVEPFHGTCAHLYFLDGLVKAFTGLRELLQGRELSDERGAEAWTDQLLHYLRILHAELTGTRAPGQ
jgi:hypothetical protein